VNGSASTVSTRPMKLWHAIADLNLLVLAADHLITGLAGVFFPKRSAWLYQHLFGAQFPVDSPVVAVLRPWGALGAFAALAGVLPVWNPVRYRAILYVLLLLLLLRVFMRFSYDSATLQFFGLSSRRNYFHIYLVLQCGAIIALQLVWW
jgi:hypothetical protein